MAEDSEIIGGGSNLKAFNRYGQNGYQGPASDTPGKHTTSGFLPAVSKPAESADGQCRKVSAEQYPTTHGMKGAAAGPKIVKKLDRSRRS
jgi:hypothetical protein